MSFADLPLQSRKLKRDTVKDIMDAYRKEDFAMLPASAIPPPIVFSYADLPESPSTAITSASIDYGPAVDFVVRILTHIAHSEHTLYDYSTQLRNVIKKDSATRNIWNASELMKASPIGPSPPQIHNFLLGRRTDNDATPLPLSVILTKLSSGTQKGIMGELMLSADVCKVFTQTELGRPYIGPHDISAEQYNKVKICVRHLLLSAVVHELARMLTKAFFGGSYNIPNIPSMMPYDDDNHEGGLGFAAEIEMLGAYSVIQWRGTAFQRATTDEERLWVLDNVLCTVHNFSYHLDGATEGEKTVEVEQEQFELLAESLSRCQPYWIYIPQDRPNIDSKGTTRARLNMQVLPPVQERAKSLEEPDDFILTTYSTAGCGMTFTGKVRIQ